MATHRPTNRPQSGSKNTKKGLTAQGSKPVPKKERTGRKPGSTFEDFAGFPDDNPNPVMRVGTGGLLLYANKASASLLKQWGCGKGGSLPPEWKKRIDRALSSLVAFSVDEPIGKRLFAMDIVPIAGTDYANLYGRDITERRRAEKILKENEDRFKILFELAPDAYYISDLKGNFVDGNKAAEELLGYDRNELIGSSFLKLNILGPDQIMKAAALLARNLMRKSTGPDEFVLIRKDGSQVTVEIKTHPIQIRDKTLVLGIARDIAGRKQAEEALRRSETKFRTLYNSNRDAVMLLDKKGFFDCNQAALTTFGCATREEFCSKHPADVSPPMQPDGTDSMSLADRHIDTALKKGSHRFEWMHRRADTGEDFSAEVSLSAVELDGKPVLQAVVRDVTERKRTEEELKESKILIEAVVENVPLMIFLKEATDLRFVIFNRAGEELLGYDRAALLGKNNLELFPPEQAAHFMAKDREVLDGEAGVLDIPEEPIQTARKGLRLLHTQKVCIRGRDGTTKYLLGISEDITERKRAEEKLKSLLKEKEVLVREVHHRVKNNFMVVSSLLGLQSQQVEDETIQDMFMKSRDRIRSMSLIHERLYQSEDLTHIDLSNYIRTLAADIYESFGTDPGKVSLVIEAEDVALVLDQAIPCGLIVNELISNALKYGFPGDRKDRGEIKVTLSRTGENEIELAVKDNGAGLPDDFDLRKNKSLGMKIITLLAEDQLGGKLSVDRDRGTGFRVRFKLDK